MIDLTMWVLVDKGGQVKRDPEGYMLFDTREQAKRYQGYLMRPKEWKVKKVKVTDAK
jgi:hypothetical protein